MTLCFEEQDPEAGALRRGLQKAEGTSIAEERKVEGPQAKGVPQMFLVRFL